MPEPIALTLQIGLGDNVDEDRLSQASFLLMKRLKSEELVESAGPAQGEVAEGAKGDPVTLGTLAITVLPVLLPKLVEFLVEWVKGKSGRSIKFHGVVNGQTIDFEGTQPDLAKLIAVLQGGQAGK